MIDTILNALALLVIIIAAVVSFVLLVATNIRVKEIHKYLGLHPDYPKGYTDEFKEDKEQ